MLKKRRTHCLAWLLMCGLGLPASVRGDDAVERQRVNALAEKIIAVKLARMKVFDAELKLIQTRADNGRRQLPHLEKLAELADKDLARMKKLRPTLAIAEQEFEKANEKAVEAARGLELLKQSIAGAATEVELVQARKAELQAEVEEIRARAALLQVQKTPRPSDPTTAPPADAKNEPGEKNAPTEKKTPAEK